MDESKNCHKRNIEILILTDKKKINAESCLILSNICVSSIIL